MAKQQKHGTSSYAVGWQFVEPFGEQGRDQFAVGLTALRREQRTIRVRLTLARGCGRVYVCVVHGAFSTVSIGGDGFGDPSLEIECESPGTGLRNRSSGALLLKLLGEFRVSVVVGAVRDRIVAFRTRGIPQWCQMGNGA
jgi:hypothetical protein